MTTSSAHLQHQADQARVGLSSALDDLRDSVTTTALTNGAMTFAKDGSSAIARAAIDRAMANPLAALLIGAGAVMLLSGSKSGSGGAIDETNATLRGVATKVGDIGSGLAGAASSAIDATKSAAGRVMQTTRSAAGQVASTASTAAGLATDSYGKTRDLMAKGQEQGAQTIHDAQQLVADARTRLEKFADEQPVLVAALGLAFGAAVGASLPITEAERSFVGTAGKKVADKGTEIVKQAADSVAGAVAGNDMKAKVGEVAEAVTSTVAGAFKA